MVYTGNTNLTNEVRYYLSPAQIAEDATGGWLLKDSSAGTTYYGWTLGSTSQNAAVWKIRREVVSGNVTTVTYADGNANHDNIWANRASLSYA